MNTNNRKKFPEIDNGIREFFNRDRKFDSFYDESKRSYHYGKEFTFKTNKADELFEDSVIFLFKKWKISIDEIYEGFIHYSNEKESSRSKFKIVKYNKVGKSIMIQYLSPDDTEKRISIDISKKLFRKNAYKVSYVEYIKTGRVLFGLKDELRKRLFRKNVIYKAALLGKELLKGHESNEKMEIKKIIIKFKNKKGIYAL